MSNQAIIVTDFNGTESIPDDFIKFIEYDGIRYPVFKENDPSIPGVGPAARMYAEGGNVYITAIYDGDQMNYGFQVGINNISFIYSTVTSYGY